MYYCDVSQRQLPAEIDESAIEYYGMLHGSTPVAIVPGDNNNTIIIPLTMFMAIAWFI